MITQRHIGDALRKARVARGLTEKALADAVGTDQATVSRIETGVRKPKRPMLAISKYLDVPVTLEDVC